MSRRGESCDLVLGELRRGPRTTAELAAATSLSLNAVSCAIRRARTAGCRITNVRVPGGHHCGLYVLDHDPAAPRRRPCAWTGCETLLSASNATIYCRQHLADVAYFAYLERLNEVLDELLGGEAAQLELFAEAV